MHGGTHPGRSWRSRAAPIAMLCAALAFAAGDAAAQSATTVPVTRIQAVWTGPRPAAEAHRVPASDSSTVDTLTVRGTVSDSATGEPLPATEVRVAEVDRQDLTGADGTFRLTRLPPGRYTLVFEHLGYRTVEREVAVPAEGPVRVAMATSALDLPGLIVTAAMGARTRSEAHSLSQVLGGRELQQRLDVTLAETLESEPGLASASMGPAPARPVIRGLGGDRILILEDGERMGDVSSTSPDHAVSADAASARRVEVVRGPAALFYGSNALGGVVNVVREEIPTSLSQQPRRTVRLQGQTARQGGTVAGLAEQAFGPVGVRFEGTGRWAGNTITPVGELTNTGITTYSGSVGGAWVGDEGHAGAAVRAYRSSYGIPPDPVSGHPEGVTIEVERDALRGEGVTDDALGLGHLTATVGVTRYDHREIEASGAVGTAFGLNTASGELVLRPGGTGVRAGGFGLRGQWQDYTSDNGRAVVRSTERSGAIYGVDHWEIGAAHLEAGARYDVHYVTPSGVADVRNVDVRDRTFHNVSGSVSVLWEMVPDVRLGASVSRAFRAPSADELFSQGPHLAAYTYEVGNPELDAEVGLGADLFVRVSRPDLSAEAGVFWNEIGNYTYPTNTGDRRGSLFVYRHVNTDARFYGAEAAARWAAVGPLVLDGKASWVRAHNLALDEPLPLIPPVNGSLTVRWEREGWFAELGWRWALAQERVPTRPELPAGVPGYCDEVAPGDPCRPTPGDYLATDGYGLLNGGLGYRWFPGGQVHSVTLRGENLTDTLYRNHLSRIKEL
ncbi:MAG: TonB-dependent receptor, partial [Longimicrobiales bacterium]|nr:TonB-dependent receptor [Longimicrobiales bacterium]